MARSLIDTDLPCIMHSVKSVIMTHMLTSFMYATLYYRALRDTHRWAFGLDCLLFIPAVIFSWPASIFARSLDISNRLIYTSTPSNRYISIDRYKYTYFHSEMYRLIETSPTLPNTALDKPNAHVTTHTQKLRSAGLYPPSDTLTQHPPTSLPNVQDSQ